VSAEGSPDQLHESPSDAPPPLTPVERGGRARLFVALELPAGVRAALAEWRERALADVSGLRPVRSESMHATLVFLGSRPLAEIEPIGAAIAACAGARPAPAAVGEPLWLPARRPRVLAVELDDPVGALAIAQSSISRALQAGGWYAPEGRPFVAHVTVARVAHGARIRPTALPSPAPRAFTGSQITLFRSHTVRGGARYEPLRSIDLGSVPPPSDPLAVVHRFHAEQATVYAGGPLESLRPLLSQDVVWRVPGHSAIAGEHRGIDAVLAYFAKRRAMTDATFRVTVHGTALIGDRVVQLAGGRAERDGGTVAWETAGVFRVAGGLIAECWLVPFDLYAFDEIWQ
jgi:RNA 2',3'-cyclic 3'-phosphodiesterase